MALKYSLLRRSFVLLSAVMALAGAAGCGKKEVPDPPLSRNRLTIEMFKNLEENKPEQAIEKIIKLKALDTENIFLAELEESEVSNIYMSTVQQQLNAGDIDAAIKTVDAARKRHGLYRSLIQADAELKKLRSLKESVTGMLQAESSEQAFAEIELSGKIAGEYPPAKALEPMLAAKSAEATRMARQESIRTRFSMLCDTAAMRSDKNKCADTIAAEFEIENNLPENKNSRIPATLISSGQ
ncbi:MAG: hypothetical protein WCI51_21575 [Lentisphaerota bacterium]